MEFIREKGGGRKNVEGTILTLTHTGNLEEVAIFAPTS